MLVYHGPYLAMGDDVRIPHDRRGEVGVVLKGQAVVTDVLGTLVSLGHGADDHLLDQGFFRMTYRFAQ